MIKIKGEQEDNTQIFYRLLKSVGFKRTSSWGIRKMFNLFNKSLPNILEKTK